MQPIPLQIDFPTLRKSLKITIPPRTSLKQMLSLLSAKLDVDYSSFQVIAKIKHSGTKTRIPPDIPIMYAAEGYPQNPLIIEVTLSYEGG
jgi:hypothetical protein